MSVKRRASSRDDRVRGQGCAPDLDQHYVAVDVETQELVGVGKSPEEAIQSAAPGYLTYDLETYPATWELADKVRAGEMTCWITDDDGLARSEGIDDG